MEFSPFNKIVQLCMQGMALEEQGQSLQALSIFERAWKEASDDFEKYLAAFYLARQQESATEELHWLQKALAFAQQTDSEAAKTAYGTLHGRIADTYEKLGDSKRSTEQRQLADSFSKRPADTGPFYHGTRADLKKGDLLTAGGQSNYQSELKMNHIYFTALKNAAGLAAALAKTSAKERLYIVEPTGPFENDPNVTDKKFPGNPTRSYRSALPLKIVGEITDWERPTPEELQHFRNKLENNKGEIIN